MLRLLQFGMTKNYVLPESYYWLTSCTKTGQNEDSSSTVSLDTVTEHGHSMSQWISARGFQRSGFAYYAQEVIALLICSLLKVLNCFRRIANSLWLYLLSQQNFHRKFSKTLLISKIYNRLHYFGPRLKFTTKVGKK